MKYYLITLEVHAEIGTTKVTATINCEDAVFFGKKELNERTFLEFKKTNFDLKNIDGFVILFLQELTKEEYNYYIEH